jgi:hypothetical protein
MKTLLAAAVALAVVSLGAVVVRADVLRDLGLLPEGSLEEARA